jgi:hypothetical protein
VGLLDRVAPAAKKRNLQDFIEISPTSHEFKSHPPERVHKAKVALAIKGLIPVLLHFSNITVDSPFSKMWKPLLFKRLS